MGGVIFHHDEHRTGIKHFLLLVQVQVYQTGCLVEQNLVNQGQIIGIGAVDSVEPVSNNQFFRFRPLYLYNLRFRDILFYRRGKRRDLFWPQHRKFFINQFDRRIWIEISSDTECHIVRHIMGAVVIDNIFDRRVFQVLGLTDGSLCPVRMFFKKTGKKIFPYLAAVTVHGHVFLFIDGFKFGMKEPHNRIAEPFCFDGQPLVKFV